MFGFSLLGIIEGIDILVKTRQLRVCESLRRDCLHGSVMFVLFPGTHLFVFPKDFTCIHPLIYGYKFKVFFVNEAIKLRQQAQSEIN